MLKGNGQNQQAPSMTLEELQNMQFYVDMVQIPDDVYTTLSAIRQKLKDEGIRPSDRRFKQSLSLLQAKALIEQRQVMIVEDIVLLRNTLWESVEQKDTVEQIVKYHAQDVIKNRLEEIQKEAKEILSRLKEDSSTEAGMEAADKFKALEKELNSLLQKNPDRSGEVKQMIKKIQQAKKKIAESILGV